jgi:hypothetical protein
VNKSYELLEKLHPQPPQVSANPGDSRAGNLPTFMAQETNLESEVGLPTAAELLGPESQTTTEAEVEAEPEAEAEPEPEAQPNSAGL